MAMMDKASVSVPSDATLERLAKLPESVKKMALAYAQGVMGGQKMAGTRKRKEG